MRIHIPTIKNTQYTIQPKKYTFEHIDRLYFNKNTFAAYNRLNVYNLLEEKGQIYKEPIILNFDSERFIQDLFKDTDFIKLDINDFDNDRRKCADTINKIVKQIQTKEEITVRIIELDMSVLYFTFNNNGNVQNIDNRTAFSILHNFVSKVKSDLKYVFSSYNSIYKNINIEKDNEFKKFYEHLCFNFCFNFGKKYKLKINNIYFNEFNGPKEFIIRSSYNKYFFPETKNGKGELLLSNVGLYSITSVKATEQIINVVRDILKFINRDPRNLTITDGTAGMGGDSISFAKHFKKVVSVEIVKEHYEICKNNFKYYSLDNIELLNADYTKIYDKLNNDIVFLDSPWGGSDYVLKDKAELKMFGTDLKFSELVKNLLDKNKDLAIFIKCPKNFSTLDLTDTVIQNSVLKQKYCTIIGISNFLLVCFY